MLHGRPSGLCSVGALAWAGVVLFAGCERAALPRAPVTEIPVTGKVTLDGQPLAGAAVVFTSPSLDAFTATTKEDGSYQLSTSYGGESPCTGLCRVTISKILLPAGVQPLPDTSPWSQGGKESLPAKYSNSGSTELTADVPQQGGVFDFELTGR
ncbi:MAG TPA: hypothetical protein VHC19_05710 [Pirellulales bacterium]|nr:hypothetical protein [Pirellulales bacterium]